MNIKTGWKLPLIKEFPNRLKSAEGMMIKKERKVKPLGTQESLYTALKQDQLLSDIFMLAGAAVTLITLFYISL